MRPNDAFLLGNYTRSLNKMPLPTVEELVQKLTAVANDDVQHPEDAIFGDLFEGGNDSPSASLKVWKHPSL